jgi:hypothetical protein
MEIYTNKKPGTFIKKPKQAVYFIAEDDLGSRGKYVYSGDKVLYVDFRNVMGYVQEQDIGKKMVCTEGVWQVENDRQFTKRIK